MYKRILQWGIVLGAAVVCSCSQQSPTIAVQDTIVKPFYPTTAANQLNKGDYNHAYKFVSFIKINTKDSLILSGENKIIEVHNKILFVDKRLSFVNLIDSAGNIQKVSSLGPDKGQYLSTDDVNYDRFNDEIQILSNEKGAFLRFDAKGNFKNEVKLDFFATAFQNLSADRLVFFVNQDKSKASGFYDLLITDKNGKILSRAYDWSKFPKRASAFTGGFGISKDPVFFPPYCDSIFSITANKIKLKHIVSFGTRSIPYEVRVNEPIFLKTRFLFDFMHTPLFITDNYMQINFNSPKGIETAIINKSNSKVLMKSNVADLFPLNQCFKGMGIGKSNTIYSLLLMENVFSYLKGHPDAWNVLQKEYPELYTVLRNSKPYDNPLIVKYQPTF